MENPFSKQSLEIHRDRVVHIADTRTLYWRLPSSLNPVFFSPNKISIDQDAIKNFLCQWLPRESLIDPNPDPIDRDAIYNPADRMIYFSPDTVGLGDIHIKKLLDVTAAQGILFQGHCHSLNENSPNAIKLIEERYPHFNGDLREFTIFDHGFRKMLLYGNEKKGFQNLGEVTDPLRYHKFNKLFYAMFALTCQLYEKYGTTFAINAALRKMKEPLELLNQNDNYMFLDTALLFYFKQVQDKNGDGSWIRVVQGAQYGNHEELSKAFSLPPSGDDRFPDEQTIDYFIRQMDVDVSLNKFKPAFSFNKLPHINLQSN